MKRLFGSIIASLFVLVFASMAFAQAPREEIAPPMEVGPPKEIISGPQEVEGPKETMPTPGLGKPAEPVGKPSVKIVCPDGDGLGKQEKAGKLGMPSAK